MTEEWRPVDGFPNYEVSSEGRVRSLDREEMCEGFLRMRKGKILAPDYDTDGYCRVTLCKDGKRYHKFVHRLVGLSFLPNPENKPTIDHINRLKTDNNLSNLRWATMQEQGKNKSHKLSNTGHKYIHKKPCNTYQVKSSKTFKTLDEAIEFRDMVL